MRLIFLLFLLILLVESSPSMSECDYETSNAKFCKQKFSGVFGKKIVPKEELEAKKPKIQDYLTCFEKPKCENTQIWLKIQKTFLDVQERMSEIHSCVGNGTWDRLEFTCPFTKKYNNCADFQRMYDEFPKVIKCMIENVAKEEKCSAADLEKFKQVMKLLPEILKMMSDFEEKQEEYEKMSDKKIHIFI
ncbi:unnamed protein product [Caenorhabditis nigoni]